ncbi:hypothetical protein [Actinomadura sp. HBU206391]|uniref:hypothetical protein n=1 Tax=Actinomadura sp. HBU206391 TaxID=2731692 RepID=UPI0016506CBB|nr:hypothetical protein [Actinomadura sp. HBU206391]MBC6462382.1 hypothetical protein [Actinomadura sp. HBU206391]
MPKPPLDRFTIDIGGNAAGQVITGHGDTAHLGHAETVPADATRGGADETGTDAQERQDRRAAGRIIVVADAQGSGRRTTDRQRLRTRQDLFQIFQTGADALDRPLNDLDPTDRGDGLQLVVSPEVVSPADLLDVFLVTVAAALHEHAEASSDATRLRLRIAVHFGYVDRAGEGWSGEPLVHAARLVDADEVRLRLQDSRDACLALVVSDDFHRTIVRHGYAHAGPSDYDRVDVAEKETSSHAWVRLI